MYVCVYTQKILPMHVWQHWQADTHARAVTLSLAHFRLVTIEPTKVSARSARLDATKRQMSAE